MATALVTGATAGIGAAFARHLAGRGHDLVLVARNRERLDDLAGELRERHGVRCESLPADLSDRRQLDEVARRLAEPSAPVDLLVNNAGFGLNRPFLTSDVADQERLLDVLCRAVLVLSHAGAGAMVTRGHGAVVNVSSVAGFTAAGTYAAAKAWTTTFSEALAAELAGTGVTCTALCPGFVRTEFHDRAGMDMSALPSWAWLDADRLVAQCLADVRRGRPVSVPSPTYKVAAWGARHAPRPLIRAVSAEVLRRRHRSSSP